MDHMSQVCALSTARFESLTARVCTLCTGWVGSLAAEATKRGKKRAGVDSSAEEGMIAPQRARSALDIYVS